MLVVRGSIVASELVADDEVLELLNARKELVFGRKVDEVDDGIVNVKRVDARVDVGKVDILLVLVVVTLVVVVVVVGHAARLSPPQYSRPAILCERPLRRDVEEKDDHRPGSRSTDGTA